MRVGTPINYQESELGGVSQLVQTAALMAVRELLRPYPGKFTLLMVYETAALAGPGKVVRNPALAPK